MKNLEKEIESIVYAKGSLGLLKGKMGVCIAWFVLGERKEESLYTQKAQNLLQQILSAFSFNNCLDLQDGLTGIALGLNFLVQKGYVEGDVNKLLRHIDAHIYKVGCQAMEMNLQGKDVGAMVDILLYETVRYKNIENPIWKECCRRFMMALMNHIYINRTTTFYEESMPFCLKNHLVQYLWTLMELRKMGIEKKRIEHILSEMPYRMFAHVPHLHPNRLLLFVVVSKIAQETNLSPWIDYANLLKKTINLDNVLSKDIYDKNIFVMNGIAGVYLLADYCRQHLGIDIPLNAVDIQERIDNSSAWERMEQDEEFLKKFYSLNGYCGIKLFLKYLENRKNEE